MCLFNSTVLADSIFDVDLALLEKLNVKALLLDVDNTLAIHHTSVPVDGVTEWIKEMQTGGIELYILSNAKSKRLIEFAGNVGLPYFYLSLKPLPFKINRAVRKIGIPKKNVAMVGDQLFTDVIGGKLAGVKTIWVELMQPEESMSFRIKRKIEKRIKHRLKGGIR